MTLRSAHGALAEYESRRRTQRAIRREMFDRQLALHDDPAQFRAAYPGRRGGKSEYIPRSCALDVYDAGPNEVVLLGAETQKKAIALHWANLAWLKARRGLRLTPNMQMGRWTTPWGAAIQFWGFKDHGAVDLARGFKLRSAKLDEVASYASELKYLTQDVLKPALSDTGGTLTLCGTPSITRAGPWFEICNTQKLGPWSKHHWTLLDNPKFPRDARDVLAAALKDLGGDPDNATYCREWLGLWVDDPEKQVYAYLSTRNDTQGYPAHWTKDGWVHVVVVDFGVNDDCAWSVLACHPHERRVYVLQSQKQNQLCTDEAALITASLCAQFEPIKLIGDTGGLGAAYALEWNRRYAGLSVEELLRRHTDERLGLSCERTSRGYAMPGMVCADKLEKRAHIDFANNELRAGRVLFVQPHCEPLTNELSSLPWHDEKRLKESKVHPNHCADTFVYGITELRPYLNDAPEPSVSPHVNTPAYDAWQIEQEIRALRGDPDSYY